MARVTHFRRDGYWLGMTRKHIFASGLWLLLAAPLTLQAGCSDGNLVGSTSSPENGDGSDRDGGEDPPLPCPPRGYEWTFQGTNFQCADVELSTLPVAVTDIDTTNAGDDFHDKCSPNSSSENELIYHFRAPETAKYRFWTSMTATRPKDHILRFITGDCDDYQRFGQYAWDDSDFDVNLDMAAGDNVLIVFEGGKGGTLHIRPIE